ncbi:hypothetical protein [Nocardia fluminea]|uniref:hypothetical protein n=1 Tax=Nocardia fluminea TaxID=134984 RepID=UPI003D0DD537
MAGSVEIDPQKLRKASELTEELSTKVTAAADKLRGALAGVEADLTFLPWGNDKRGKKFADGPTGYTAARNNLLEGAAGAAQTLSDMAKGQREAANSLTGTDLASSEHLGPGKA